MDFWIAAAHCTLLMSLVSARMFPLPFVPFALQTHTALSRPPHVQDGLFACGHDTRRALIGAFDELIQIAVTVLSGCSQHLASPVARDLALVAMHSLCAPVFPNSFNVLVSSQVFPLLKVRHRTCCGGGCAASHAWRVVIWVHGAIVRGLFVVHALLCCIGV